MLILVVLLVAASFLIGTLYTKVQYLEKQGGGQTAGVTTTNTAQGTQQQAPPEITSDDIKSWAAEIGLDTNKFNTCFDGKTFQANIDKDKSDAATVGANATPSFYVNGVLIEGAQPFDAFKTEIDKAIAGTQTGTKVDVAIGHLPAYGQESAAVTMIEFSDFQCPFCKSFFQQTFPQIKSEYIDTGKVKFYYRHLPLDFHPNAEPFANAAECANAQGKFWEMHDTIFQKQG